MQKQHAIVWVNTIMKQEGIVSTIIFENKGLFRCIAEGFQSVIETSKGSTVSFN